MDTLNENGLRSYIRERVLNLLKEGFYEEAEQPAEPQEGEQQGVGYSVDTFVSDKELKGHAYYVIGSITNKLNELKAMCDKYQIEFEWAINRVEGANASQSGWKITANAAMPDLKVAGYTYVGSVVPMTDTYALVAPSKEFKDNFEVLDKIKTTVAREKCAGCNRAAERGIYYVFREDATGELKKYGSNCAKRYLGISVDASINKVFTYLANALEAERMLEAMGGYDGDYGYGGGGGDWRPRGYNQVAAACAYLAIFGIPEARFSFKYCDEYSQLVRYYQTCDHREPAFTSFQKQVDGNSTKINNYISSFYSGIYNFCMAFQPQSDFDESIKSNGMYLGGIHVTRAAERYFREGIFPYVALRFFQAKRDEGIEVTTVEEFYGTKDFLVTVLNKVEKRSVEGNGTYLQVYAKTDNNEYIAWTQNQDMPELGIGKKVTVYGEYGGENGKYCVLRRVRVMGQQQLDQRAQRAAMVYPENGTRFRNAEFRVVRASGNYVIMADQNGCEYFVSNTRKDRWGEVTGLIIQDWEQVFRVGNTIRLSGTVDSYTDRYGELKHTLKRVAYDESSFPEIDFSQTPIRELIYDRKKVIVDGRAVDIRDARFENEGFILVQWADNYDSYSVYDMNNKTVVCTTDDWDEAKDMIRFAPFMNNPAKMKEKGVVLRMEQNGKIVLDKGQVWLDTGDFGQYSRKGDWYLIWNYLNGTYAYYYNPTTMKTFGYQELDFTQVTKDEGLNILKQLYDKVPATTAAPATAGVNEGYIMKLVYEGIKRALGLLN